MKKEIYMNISLGTFALSFILLIFYKTIYYIDMNSDFHEMSQEKYESYISVSKLIYTLFQSSILLFFIASVISLFFYFFNRKTSSDL